MAWEHGGAGAWGVVWVQGHGVAWGVAWAWQDRPQWAAGTTVTKACGPESALASEARVVLRSQCSRHRARGSPGAHWPGSVADLVTPGSRDASIKRVRLPGYRRCHQRARSHKQKNNNNTCARGWRDSAVVTIPLLWRGPGLTSQHPHSGLTPASWYPAPPSGHHG